MARSSCTFKQRDVTAAVRAVKAAGVEVARVEVDGDGKIVVVAVGHTAQNDLRDFDTWKARHAD
jgi:ACT domain-containing protein